MSDGGEDGRVVGACIVSSECSLRCNADNERYGACRWGRLRPLVGRSVGRLDQRERRARVRRRPAETGRVFR